MEMDFVFDFWDKAVGDQFKLVYFCGLRPTAEKWIREQNKPANHFAIVTATVLDGEQS